jgi:LysM repeat protein
MRLTRRGRLLVTLLIAGVLLVALSLARTATQAAGTTTPQRPARPTVVVQSGDTLWDIARKAAPGADPRATVARILELNDLESASSVRAGQQLTLP